MIPRLPLRSVELRGLDVDAIRSLFQGSSKPPDFSMADQDFYLPDRVVAGFALVLIGRSNTERLRHGDQDLARSQKWLLQERTWLFNRKLAWHIFSSSSTTTFIFLLASW